MRGDNRQDNVQFKSIALQGETSRRVTVSWTLVNLREEAVLIHKLKKVPTHSACDLTLGLWLKHNIDFYTQRFSPLVSGVARLWPPLSSQKTITQPLLPRHWLGQGWHWIVEDYYFHSGIQFKQTPGEEEGDRIWEEDKRRLTPLYFLLLSRCLSLPPSSL